MSLPAMLTSLKPTFFAKLNCIIAIGQNFHTSFGSDFTELTLLFDAFPIHNSRLNDVKNLEENQSISQIRVQIIDKRFHTQRIHPVPEHFFFTRFFNDWSF